MLRERPQPPNSTMHDQPPGPAVGNHPSPITQHVVVRPSVHIPKPDYPS